MLDAHHLLAYAPSTRVSESLFWLRSSTIDNGFQPGITPEKSSRQPTSSNVMDEAHATLSFLTTGKIIPSSSSVAGRPNKQSEAKLAKDYAGTSPHLEQRAQVLPMSMHARTQSRTHALFHRHVGARAH